MTLETFNPVKGKDYTFNEIFGIYDAQFEAIREFILTLGDYYVVETFTNDTAKNITLENTYQEGQIMVYVNEVVQWPGVGFEYVSPRKIRLTQPRFETDTVRVMIIKSNFLQTNIEYYIDSLRRDCNNVHETYLKALNLKALFDEIGLRLDQKITDYNKEKDLIEALVNRFGGDADTVQTAHADIQALALKLESYYKSVLDIEKDLRDSQGLEPEELATNEVLLARSGADTLAARLRKMPYSFDSEQDMQTSIVLESGNDCVVLKSGKGAKFFKVTDDETAIPAGVEKYQVGVEGKDLWCYLISQSAHVNKVIKAPIRVEKVEFSPRLAEAGTPVVSVNLKWESNVIPSEVTIDGTKYEAYTNSGTHIIPVAWTNDSTMSLTLKDAAGYSDKVIVPFKFVNGIYYGVATEPETLNTAFIRSLTKKLTVSPSVEFDSDTTGEQFVWFICPAEYVGLKFYMDSMVGGFHHIQDLSYENELGFTEDYSIYRSDYSGLGEIKVEIRGFEDRELEIIHVRVPEVSGGSGDDPLDDSPFKKIVGESEDDAIDLSTLDVGHYFVSGYYKVSAETGLFNAVSPVELLIVQDTGDGTEHLRVALYITSEGGVPYLNRFVFDGANLIQSEKNKIESASWKDI